MGLGLELDSTRAGVLRDLGELASSGAPGWILLTLLFALPVLSLALLLAGRRLAVVPLGLSVLIFFAWCAYYAAPGPTVSGPAGAWAVFFWILVGWFLLVLTALRPWRSRIGLAFRTGVDPRPLLRGPDGEHVRNP